MVLFFFAFAEGAAEFFILMSIFFFVIGSLLGIFFYRKKSKINGFFLGGVTGVLTLFISVALISFLV